METQMVRNKNGQINIVFHEEKEKKLSNRETKNNGPFAHIEREFSSFIGMKHLKQTVKEIYATIVVNQKRKDIGLNGEKQVLHTLFKGNPGTGKTTVARKLAHIYFEMGLLSKGQFIEAERADLVGEYIGQTAQKTRAIVQKSLGGMLFIDEAYSLARGGEKDFGKEAIDTLVKHMEDHHNDFVLILAGYPNEMDRFLTLNPGLKSRFPFILDFADYDVDQLMDIAKQMTSLREYRLTREAAWKLENHLQRKTRQTEVNFANARYVRNIIEEGVRKHALRLLNANQFTVDDLIYLTGKDLQLMNDIRR